jgi:hypothetical protein
MMMNNLSTLPRSQSKTMTLVWIAFVGITLSACASTAENAKIHISTSKPLDTQGFRLVDARAQDSRDYRQNGKSQYLGDSNFESPPTELIASRLNDKLGDLLKGREISLLHFQARITAPFFQTYPGMPLGAEVLGRALNLPQLGYPHYANVSLRGAYLQKEFSGAKSVQFYVGSGKSEVSEAFDGALGEAAASLRLLLEAENTASGPAAKLTDNTSQ